ncbi:HutD family protein [Kaistia dalseonensis]|uniref:Environmental stress-induced protein Ves n=1 Tax=Kaistia dalseonensis TaxID=410840 RepID=A0ABU0H2W1_9HYPH|nr:HutD family protein [Kaistia dalseonensis]MCX5493282.1 HutD family protein [Kaistia dalseonensis]MDQ0435839.1 environmental stress-induced protein Ves [Kaistia dalseonensis]
MSASGAAPVIRHLRLNDYRVMPWRNGRGTTVEIAREDEPSGAMLWRVSKADVNEDGDFSPFPGLDRILTLVEGAGFDLDFGPHGRIAPIEPLVPVRFSGDWATRAENVRGASRDLNVMVARGAAQAELTIHRDGTADGALADRNVFLALDGAWTVAIDGTSHALVAGETLLVFDGRGLPLGVAGSGVLAWVAISLLH